VCYTARLVINLDHNATTPLAPPVSAVLGEIAGGGITWGNPSSVHGLGRMARAKIEDARRQVASALACDPLEVVFTSGGTEADNLAVIGSVRALAAAGRPCGILTSPLEHPAVLEAVRACAQEGGPVVAVPVDPQGRVTAEGVAETLRRTPGIGLVTLSAANHELGNTTALPEVVQAVKSVQRDILVHTDAVQAVGKIGVSFREWGVDLLSLSAHKLGGLPGAGALLVRKGLRLTSPLKGGQQERGFRPGTEGLLGIVALGVAVTECTVNLHERGEALRRVYEDLRAGLTALGARIHGDPSAHVGNTLNVAFEGCDGELLAMNLDLAGIAVSTGAACSSGSTEPSKVLLGLGLSKRAASEAIRISLSPATRREEIAALLGVLPDIVARVRATSQEDVR